MIATAFDFPSADSVAELDIPAYKIASGDVRNVPLLKHVARFRKPIFRIANYLLQSGVEPPHSKSCRKH